MANAVSNVGFTAPSDYALETQQLERQRQLALALQQQGMNPLGNTEMVGGWAIPRSPMEGIGKLAQALSGSYQQKQIGEQEKALNAKYQQDTADTLSGAYKAGMGTPGTPEQAPTVPNDDEGNPNPGVPAQPAVAGNRQLMAEMLLKSQNPTLQQLGLSQSQAEMQRQMMIQTMNAAGYGTQAATPNQAMGAEANAGGSPGPTNAAAARIGTPNAGSGVNPRTIALLMSGNDPNALSELGKMEQEAYSKANAPINVRPFGTVFQGGKAIYTAPGSNGIQTTYNNGQPSQSVMPGALDANAAVVGNKAGAEAPFSMQQMDVPVYLPGGDQINVKMNAVQAHQYQTTGQLPPEVAASIPGLNQAPQAPPTQAPPGLTPLSAINAGGPPGTAPAQNPPGFPVVSPQAQAVRDSTARTLRANEPPSMIPGGDVRAPTARPVVGRTQSQTEQITQKRQEAGGKALDEAFAKDYSAFVQGGAQDATKQLAQLGDTITALKTRTDLTGPIRGRLPDVVRSVTNPEAIAMRQRVEEVVQRSLRAILGAQFTEKEGERLIERAYDPAQPERENYIRVQRLFNQLDGALKSKTDAARYFEKNNTLQGWQGKLPAMSDFDVTTNSNGVGGSWNDERRTTPRAQSRRVVVDY